MVCNILAEIDSTESSELPNSTVLLANRIARKCRSVWPVDNDRIKGGFTDTLQAAVVKTLDSYDEFYWIKCQERATDTLEYLCADLCGDISEWLNEYMCEICNTTAQKILSGIFADTDFSTLAGDAGDGEKEGCGSS